eukprot:CAMPEP_0174993492 /NCGR_PEP_ID=MMETSP0004_2-20121128/23105_1 /TAXON_ID=420556 /ORGANISM="Ochromonas sp., Strain CCMP1393" /LENGTH=87 /DNA_ID=CAMNT_0016247613 /DNA_START=1064 /DNA_END=1327 /DNA_ORIENTATION=+
MEEIGSGQNAYGAIYGARQYEAAGECNEGISAELHFRRRNSYQPTWLQTAESTCSAGAPPNFYSFERQLILLDSTFADISQHHKNTV